MPHKGAQQPLAGSTTLHVLLQILGVSVDSPFSHLAWVQTGAPPSLRLHLMLAHFRMHCAGKLSRSRSWCWMFPKSRNSSHREARGTGCPCMAGTSTAF